MNTNNPIHSHLDIRMRVEPCENYYECPYDHHFTSYAEPQSYRRVCQLKDLNESYYSQLKELGTAPEKWKIILLNYLMKDYITTRTKEVEERWRHYTKISKQFVGLTYIYKITNLRTGRIYIGIHHHKDKEEYHTYLGSSQKLNAEIMKYGPLIFRKDIIEVLDTYDTLKEQLYIIKAMKTHGNENVYNYRKSITPEAQSLWRGHPEIVKELKPLNPKEEHSEN